MAEIIRLSLTSGANNFSVSLNSIEDLVLTRINFELFGGGLTEFARLIWHSSPDHPTVVGKSRIAEILDQVIRHNDQFDHLLHYKYTHRREENDGPIAGGSITRGSSGYRIDGDPFHFYSISNGVAHCDLKKLAVGSMGKGYVVSTTDCRELKTIATDNHGLLTIQKRKVKNAVKEKLTAMISFLQVQEEAEIIIR